MARRRESGMSSDEDDEGGGSEGEMMAMGGPSGAYSYYGQHDDGSQGAAAGTGPGTSGGGASTGSATGGGGGSGGRSIKPSSGRFLCHVCGQGFQRKNGLARHMRSHTGEKPFACSFCKFKSTRTDSLQRHMKLHMASGEAGEEGGAGSAGPGAGESGSGAGGGAGGGGGGKKSAARDAYAASGMLNDAANLMSIAAGQNNHTSNTSRASASASAASRIDPALEHAPYGSSSAAAGGYYAPPPPPQQQQGARGAGAYAQDPYAAHHHAHQHPHAHAHQHPHQLAHPHQHQLHQHHAPHAHHHHAAAPPPPPPPAAFSGGAQHPYGVGVVPGMGTPAAGGMGSPTGDYSGDSEGEAEADDSSEEHALGPAGAGAGALPPPAGAGGGGEYGLAHHYQHPHAHHAHPHAHGQYGSTSSSRSGKHSHSHPHVHAHAHAAPYQRPSPLLGRAPVAAGGRYGEPSPPGAASASGAAGAGGAGTGAGPGDYLATPPPPPPAALAGSTSGGAGGGGYQQQPHAYSSSPQFAHPHPHAHAHGHGHGQYQAHGYPAHAPGSSLSSSGHAHAPYGSSSPHHAHLHHSSQQHAHSYQQQQHVFDPALSASGPGPGPSASASPSPYGAGAGAGAGGGHSPLSRGVGLGSSSASAGGSNANANGNGNGSSSSSGPSGSGSGSNLLGSPLLRHATAGGTASPSLGVPTSSVRSPAIGSAVADLAGAGLAGGSSGRAGGMLPPLQLGHGHGHGQGGGSRADSPAAAAGAIAGQKRSAWEALGSSGSSSSGSGSGGGNGSGSSGGGRAKHNHNHHNLLIVPPPPPTTSSSSPSLRAAGNLSVAMPPNRIADLAAVAAAASASGTVSGGGAGTNGSGGPSGGAAGGPGGGGGTGSYPITPMEGFPSTERFDFGRLFSPGLNDETNLGFGSYITQAASIFSPARPNVSMAEQQAQSQGRQQHQLAQQFGLGLDASAPEADETGLFPPTQEYGAGAGSAPDSAAARYSPSVSASGVPGAAEADAVQQAQAQAPTSNRHLSLFVKNFQRHLPFVHVPTIPRLFTDILNDDASLRTSEQARQIDGLKPCTEDLLRAMAIVGAHYDAQALQKQQRAAGSKTKPDKRRKLEQPQGLQADGGEGDQEQEQELALDPALAEMDGTTAMDRTASSSSSASSVSDYSHDFYGAGELKAKLLGDFADNPPSSTRATFSHHEMSGSGSGSNNNNGSAAAGAGSSNGAGAGSSSGAASAGDSGQNGGRAGSTSSSDTGGTPAAGSGGNSNRDEPTLLRRAQALALVQFVSLFSRSRPHQNHARLLHGALITIGRELLAETHYRENQTRSKPSQNSGNGAGSEYERWREWVRQAELRRTLWAISVCDVIQSILFHVPPWLSASELGAIELADLGDETLWSAVSASQWSARKDALKPSPMDNEALSKKSFTVRNLVRSLLEVSAEGEGVTAKSQANGFSSSSEMRTAARNDPASWLDQLGTCAQFSAVISLCGHAVEVGRMDFASRHQLRQQAGLPHLPASANQAQALAQAQNLLGSFSDEDLHSFQFDVGELDSKLVQEADKIENGLARWLAKANSSSGSGGGSRPCVTETMAFYYAAQHYVIQLRQRVQVSLPHGYDQSNGNHGTGSGGGNGSGSSAAQQQQQITGHGAELLSTVHRSGGGRGGRAGGGPTSLASIKNLIGAEAVAPNTPDDVMRLIVRIRRSLKSIDGGAALLAYLGSPLLTECEMEWGQGDEFEPDVDGASFLGFFPLLEAE